MYISLQTNFVRVLETLLFGNNLSIFDIIQI